MHIFNPQWLIAVASFHPLSWGSILTRFPCSSTVDSWRLYRPVVSIVFCLSANFTFFLILTPHTFPTLFGWCRITESFGLSNNRYSRTISPIIASPDKMGRLISYALAVALSVQAILASDAVQCNPGKKCPKDTPCCSREWLRAFIVSPNVSVLSIRLLTRDSRVWTVWSWSLLFGWLRSPVIQ
jgi:hypothetical protein